MLLRILHHLSLVLSSVHDSEAKLKSKGIKKCPAYIKEVSRICQIESGIIFQIFCLKFAKKRENSFQGILILRQNTVNAFELLSY